MASTDLSFADRAAHRRWLEDQAVLPAGFRAACVPLAFTAVETGARAGMNLGLLAPDEPTPDFAAVYTTNAFPGMPVRIGRRLLAGDTLGGILVNNKIANVCAPDGMRTAEELCAAAGRALGTRAPLHPASTGIIGWRLPAAEMHAALPKLAAALQTGSVLPVAEGMMTTDLYPKVRRRQLGGGSLVGVAKGAGMIAPDLATMLVFIVTDLAVPRVLLREALPGACRESFNRLSIDSDQSTSDMVVLMASGAAGPVAADAFRRELTGLCADLAEDIARNGEGVHHVQRVTVTGAPDAAVARGVGRSVVDSPLWQCALAGNDPNVGRLVCAVGRYLGERHPELDAAACRLAIGGREVFASGRFLIDPGLEADLQSHLTAAELYASVRPDADSVFRPPLDYPPHERSVEIAVDLGLGDAVATVLGVDRTHEYISENADYRS